MARETRTTKNGDFIFQMIDTVQFEYSTVSFRGAQDLAKNNKPATDVGRQYVLPSSFKHGQRCYSQRYYDGII